MSRTASCIRGFREERSKKTMFFVTLTLLLLAWGAASNHDQQDRESMAEEFSAPHRNSIVATWTATEPGPGQNIFPQGEQIATQK